MTARTSPVRLITAALFSAVLAGTWDVWWHGALGRESFWSPPHLLLYTSVIVAIVTGFYGWWKTKERSWKWLAIALILIPASAPFDEIWHRIFGVEPVNSPLIIWSPPHVILALVLITSFLMLFVRIAHEERDVIARHLLQSATLASVLSLLLFLATPLEPTGPYHLLGFGGAAVSSGMIVLVFLLAREWMQRFGSSLTVAGIFMLLAAMNFGEKLAPNVTIQPHDHSPGWLLIFACLVPAEAVDLLHDRPLWLRGGLIGLFHGGLLYGFSSRFFDPQFQYGTTEMWTAIIASVVVGVLIGFILTFSSRFTSVFRSSL
ncbi:hypothetical protein EXS70_00410 [Candidatus Peribacteria bacterium]|nr:hypothetical protein [Candidatus Peribacteria bacterium]